MRVELPGRLVGRIQKLTGDGIRSHGCAQGSFQPPWKVLIFKPFCFKLLQGPC